MRNVTLVKLYLQTKKTKKKQSTSKTESKILQIATDNFHALTSALLDLPCKDKNETNQVL